MFKFNDPVYIVELKVKGVCKEIDLVENRFKVTYFTPEDKNKRVTEWFKYEHLKRWHSKQKNENKYYHLIRKFHQAFGQPAPDMPQRISEERKASRLDWMYEELQEFKDANTLKDEVDALIDEIYFCIGTLVEMGIKPDPIFEAVNNANMRKLHSDGKPRFREADGKIIKPDGWYGPENEIEQEIERQIKAAEKRKSQ